MPPTQRSSLPGPPDTGSSGAGPSVRPSVTDLCELLATCFHDDAITRWIVPDPRERAARLPGFFRVFVELSAACDGILADPGGDGVLLFLPPGAAPDEAALDADLARALGPYADAMRTVAALQAERHPADAPHYYLSFGGVRPGRRRGGLLTGFLTTVTRRADAEGVGAYGEASSPGGEAAIGRIGFARVGGDIVLPGGGASLRPMWRDPR
ncbi:hypothetical protein ACFYVL_36190 [Streptomyces sp. NPDC004111]|uniref:hypothetical protein n=1 Tax=Streptomyces sp. NPDC004111 TaxID=3364690 RepID=UPI0036CA582D